MSDTHQSWNMPPTDLELLKNTVHVWHVKLEIPDHDREPLQNVLVDEEIERAKKFYFEKDRRHWIVAHAALRIILGHYLNSDPRSIRFTTNEYGKPSIAYPPAGTHLHFNLSHSGDLALCAFAYNRQIGVDLEYMRAGIEYGELATHYFSAHECATLHALPANVQEEAFFLCWSRKEAYIKARGRGLSLPLDQFDVSLTPDEPAALLASREDPQAPERWSLHALAPSERYAGALVVERSNADWQLYCWQWEAKEANNMLR
jgi:4'-phosphopantetheinyl transferase